MTVQIKKYRSTKLVLKHLYTNLFNKVLALLLFCSFNLYAQEIKKDTSFDKSLQIENLNDTLSVFSDSLFVPIPTKKSNNALDEKLNYKADKYVKIDQKKKEITLFDKAELYYKDIELKAGIIILNYEKNEIYAGRIKDSTGTMSQIPDFKQGENKINPDSIRFNYKTKKALIWNTRTEQGEFKIKAAISKKENDSVYFFKGARFTTSTDVDNPEYYFYTSKVKFVPNKKVITGLTNLVIADVPTPIALPFAYFPLTKATSVSGVILPTYNDSNTRGFSLQNGGYYFALSDSYDLTAIGDYYTNGSYGLRLQSAYAKRYQFRGNFNFRYENLITSERGYPDYSKQKIYNIQWTHSRDQKANPNSSISASVNLGSSKYYLQSVNQSNVSSRINNTLSSSVSYAKTFRTVPEARLTLSATHSQNTQTESIDMTLPNMQFNVDQFFLFTKKDDIKKGFLKNINLQYNLDARNSISTTDSLFFKKEMFDSAKLGARHTIPLSTNFKIFKYLSATSALSYQETWVTKTLNKSYNIDLSDVIDETVNGFDAYRTYSFSSSLGTTIYGTFNFDKKRKIQSIRHTITPSISFNYTPSFENYYDTYNTDATGLTTAQYSRFQDGIFGAPGLTSSSNIGISIGNTVEAKVKDKDPEKEELKKINLLTNLNFSTNYNLNADNKTTLAWSPIGINGGTNLLKDKLNLNFGATLDPYALDNAGNRIGTFNIANGGSLFRMTGTNVTINYALTNNNQDEQNDQTQRNGGRSDDLFGKSNDIEVSNSELNNKEVEKDDVVDFFKTKLPFDLTFAYSLTYSNASRENKISGNSIMISANTDLTKQWKVGVSTGYDFVQKGISYTQLRFDRDLLSWRMSLNWIPLGDNSSWNFFIGIKSSVLSDLKWTKNSTLNN